MLKLGKFYRTTQNHYLLATDKKGPDFKKGAAVMCTVPLNSLILFTAHGRWRYIQVIFEEQVGYLWIPTNVSTHESLILVNLKDEESHARPVRRDKPRI